MTTPTKKPHYWGFDSLTTKRPFAISLTSVRQLGLPAFWLVLATLPVWAAIASRAAISAGLRRMARGLGLFVIWLRSKKRGYSKNAAGVPVMSYKSHLAAVSAAFGCYKNVVYSGNFYTVSGVQFVNFLVYCFVLVHFISPFCLIGLLMLCTNPSVSVEPFAFTQGAYSFQFGEHIAVDCLLFNRSFVFVYYPDCDFICVFHFVSPFRLIKYIHSIKDKYILVKRFEYQFGKLVVQS